jgi:hypothetical protein
MSEMQGESLKIKTSILKIIDGMLCSSLPQIFETKEHKIKLINTVFSCVGNDDNDDNDDIVKKLKETIQTTLKEHIIKTLRDRHDEYVKVVANTIIDYAKIVDSTVKQAK